MSERRSKPIRRRSGADSDEESQQKSASKAPAPQKAGSGPPPSPDQAARAAVARAAAADLQKPTAPLSADQLAANAARRAAERQAREAAQKRRAARPLPTPPPRRPVEPPARKRTAVPPAPAAGAAPSPADQLRQQTDQLFQRLTSLSSQSQLSGIYGDLGLIEDRLTRLPLLIDALRGRGYIHSGSLEDELSSFDEKWDQLRPRLETALDQQARELERELNQVERRVRQAANSLTAVEVTGAETAVNSFNSRVNAAQRNLRSLYGGIDGELAALEAAAQQIEWLLDQVDESDEIRLRDAEGPLMAAKAQWQQSGDEGPEGILLLTDQRLLFEQKQEIVTRKFLGIIKAESEKVQRLLLEVPARDIETTAASEQGGFLGLGRSEILDLVLGPRAPVTRARFRLHGADSDAVAALIRRVQTGEIDNDRAVAYQEQAAAADALALSFPTQCPSCFAAVQPPGRGVRSVNCEFCGTVITPHAPAG